MYSWISSDKKKKHLRKINKVIRNLNDYLKRDTLWQGRFSCKLIGSPQWVRYSDGSGGHMYCRCELSDAKTGYRRQTIWLNTNNFDSGLNGIWMHMNEFIILCEYGK